MKLFSKVLQSLGSILLTIVLIASLAFYLFHQSPVPLDEAYYLSEESGHYDRNALQERSALIQTGQSLGLDQPVFYFSIVSSLYPQQLYSLLPLRERAAARKLSYQTGEPEMVLQLRKYLTSLLQKPIDYDLKIELINLLAEDRLVPFNVKFSGLQKQLPASYQLKTTNPSLLPARSFDLSHWMPKFLWHGSGNRWHAKFMDFFSMNWGSSWVDSRSVAVKIGEALPWTILLNGIVLLLVFGLSIPLGKYWGDHPHHPLTRISRQIAYLLTVAPVFWLATLAILLLTGAYGWALFPLPSPGDFHDFTLQVILLPILILLISGIGYLARQFEDRYKSEKSEPYVKMAIARGLPQKVVDRHYILKNALLPLITLAGGSLPSLISGALVIEVLFNIPGMGRLIWFSLQAKDWPVIYIVIILIGILAWLGRWGADKLSHWLDPRTELEAA